jgi:uncharacterized repeat protein (TIGR01451 family)
MKNVQGGAGILRPIYALAFFLTLSNAFGVLPPERAMLINYDKRFGVSPDTLSQRDSAVAQLRQQVEDVRVDFDEKTGAPKWIHSAEGFLSGPDGTGPGISPATLAALPADDPNRITKAFLNDHTNLFGFGAEVLDSAVVKREFITPHNQVRTVVWEQQLDGIPVFEGLLTAHVTEKDELISMASQFLSNPATAADNGTPQRAALQAAPTVSAANAVALAARDVGEVLDTADIAAVAAPADSDPAKLQHFQAPVLTGESEARLVWLPMNDTSLRLCWQVILTSRSRSEMFLILLDTETGETLLRHCLTDYISPATYRVFTSDSPAPMTPGPATPSTIQAPIVPRVLVTLSALDTNASPNGWIDDGVNETRGNNVDAHTDLNADDVADLPRPQGSPSRVFDFPIDFTQAPASYTSASVTELFYLNNWIHDKYYQLGFTEAAGNFQNNNFGRGGLGNDAVQADAQDGSGTDNANFSTPPDGSAGRMQMYIFTGATPDRDGDLDAEIVIHEYTHGLSNRRVGGGVGISALQSGGMGEGWSDFYASTLLAEAGDDVNGTYSTGGYVTYLLSGLTQNYYYGIRRYPYCTDTNKNPLTFKDIDPAQANLHSGIPRSPIIGTTANEVHNMGEVWCNTLWEARANLVNKYGFAVGNQLILKLVTDGMNFSPANPNFLQARDAILQADQVDNGGANVGELWAAFAKRGMGFTATSPVSSTTVGLHEAFDVPFLPMTLVLPSPVSETTNYFVGQGLLYFKTPSATNVLIKLTNSNPHEISLQSTLIMPAGQTSAVVLVKVIDDSDLDGTQSATVTASAAGYATVSATMLINDNETATLNVTAPASVTEGSGPVSATVSVSGVPTANVVVNLTSSDTSEIQVPSTVTIPAGQTSVNFNLTVVDDTLIDGDRSAIITAHVANWTDGAATVIVHDNENNQLAVALPQQAREGDGLLRNAGVVSLSGTLPTNLVVSLLSDDLTELTVPPSVTILAGQISAAFNLTVVDDPIVDGSQLVHVIASANGFISGSTNITITDDESPFPPANPRPGHLEVNVPANTNLMWDNGGGLELIVNGNFENGTVNNWVLVPGVSGHFIANNGLFDPPSPDGPLPPFAGSYSALCYQTGPGLMSMYQDVSIPAGVSTATLSWAHRVRNFYSVFSTLQQFRVEIRNTNDTVLAVAFTTNPGDPLLGDWVQRTFDMKAYAGQKVRIAFWVNPGGYYLDVHVDSVSLKTSNPSSGVTNDVYFGTNPTPGPAEYLGSTSNSFWTLPLLAPQTTYYWQIVARKVGVTPGPVWQFTTKGVDHFVWDPVSSPQLVNQPFNVQLTAKDDFNTTVSNFTGSAALSAAGSGSGQVLSVNFETGLQVFTINNAFGRGNGLWHLSTGRGANPGHSPTTSLYYGHNEGPNGGGNYDTPGIANAGVVTSSSIVIPPLASGTNFLFFNYLMNVETPTNWDQAYVEVSTNNGTSYVVISSKGAGMNGNTGGLWVSNSVSLAPFAGKTILLRFRFDTIDSVANTTEGWFMDDIVIRGGPGGSPISIAPTNTGPFTAGVWQGSVAVLQPATNITLRADDGSGHFGASLPFDVGLSNDLSISMTDSPDPVAIGGSLTYLLTIGNTGPDAATGVIVSNFFPSGVVFVSAVASQGTVAPSGTLVLGNLGTLPGGSNATITIKVTATTGGTITNRATVSRIGVDPFTGNNTAVATTTVAFPSLTISDASVLEGNSGTTDMIFSVNLGPPSPGTVTVNYVTAGQTATIGVDFLATNGSLSFAPGETNKTVIVRVIGDTLYETNETLLVVLSSAVNANIADSQGIGTILNDDPLPTVSVGNVSVVEGDAGTTNAAFRVSLSAASGLATTVSYSTVSGTATAGSDFTAVSGSVGFAPGVTNMTVNVPVIGDTTIESDEMFSLQLSNPVNATLGVSLGTGTILNDDGLPGKLDHFAWSPIASPQAVGVPFGVTINAQDAFNQPASNFTGVVNLTASTGGGGSGATVRILSFILYADTTVGGEYQHTLTAISNYFPNFVETSTTTTDPATLQALLADKQVFLIVEQENAGSGVLGPLGTAWATVLQNFVNNGGIVIACSWVTEEHLILSNSGLLNLTMLSSQSSDSVSKTTDHILNQGVTAPFTGSYIGEYSAANGTVVMQATATGNAVVTTRDVGAGHVVMIGTDFFTIGTDMDRIVANAVRWAQGAAGTSIPISPTVSGNFVNGVWSGNLTALGAGTNVVLTATGAAGYRGSSAPIVVVLQNDLSVTMTDAPDPVGIGANVTYSIVVSNSGPTAATGVLATNVLPPGVAFVSAASSQGAVSNAGNLVVGDLGTINGGASVTMGIIVTPFSGGIITNRVTVYRAEADPDTNNNSAVSVTTVTAPGLSINDVSLLEGNSGTTNAVFNVVLSVPIPLPVSVNFATSDNTALAGSDYLATNGVLNFAPGQTNQTVTVVVKGDTSSEIDETFFVNLANPSNAVIMRAQGIGTILNDDVAAAVYLRSAAGAPWGSTANETAMDRVFGAGNWQDLRYETINPGVVLSPVSTFIFMEGSDFTALELQGFLITNMVAIQNWVTNGGSLFLNAAPNEGSGMSFGFGGVTLTYPDFVSTGIAVVPAHPIFNGPFTPVGTNWSGTYFAHATVSGGGLAALIQNTASSTIVLGEKNYGAGHVLFGGMTTDNFHSPQPEASNLRANILAYLSGLSGTLTSFASPPLVHSLAVADHTATITLNTLPNHHYRVFYADDLTGSPWIQLGDDVIADGYSMTVVDPAASAQQRFYRVTEVPAGGE